MSLATYSFAAMATGVLAVATGPVSLRAQTIYFDTNGNSTGTNATAAVGWTTTGNANWTTNSAGTAATSAWGTLATGANTTTIFSAGTNGTGNQTITVTGTIGNVSNLTFSAGVVTIGGTGTLNLSRNSTFQVDSTNGTSTIDATIAGAFTVTKTGNSTLDLGGSNSYTGNTTVGNGTLMLGASGNATNTPLGTTAGGTIVSATGTLDLAGFTLGSAEALSLNGVGYASQGTLINSGAAATYSGAITVTGAATTISASSGNIIITGGITSTNLGVTLTGNATGAAVNSAIALGTGTLTKTGNGTWTLAGNNTYTGLTTVSNGTLALGATGNATNTPLGTTAAGTTVAATGTLDLNGFTLGTAEALSLNGAGFNSQGTLINGNATGGATYSGNITVVTAATTISAAQGNMTLTGGINSTNLGLTLTGNATGAAVNSVIALGTGTLTKTGNGTWTLAGNNTYTGLTTIGNGTLALGATGNATNTPLGTTAAGTTVAATGTLDLNGFTLGTAEALSLNGAGFNSQGTLINGNATGGATYSGNITVVTAATTISAAQGNMTLTGGINSTNLGLTLTGNATGAAVNSVIALGTGTLTKTGNGTWTLAGNNTYTGLTTIGNGTLALGATGNATNTPLGTAAAGTTVSSTGTLDLNGFTLGTAEALTLNGVGYNSQGTLINGNATGGATYSGLITLGASSTINAAAGNITLSNVGTITGAGFNLTLTGNATGSIASIIGTSTGGLVKNGTGTWTLSGANTYSGGTTVNAGTLTMANASALGTGNVSIASPGILNSSTYGFDLTKVSGNGTLTGTSGNYTYNSAGNTSLGLTLAGGDQLVKQGLGTLTLTGNSTFTGGTTISTGTVVATANNAFGTGNVTVASGAQLNLNGTNQTLGTTTLGNASYTLTLAGTGVSGTGVLQNTYPSAGTNNIQVNGNLALSGNATINSGTNATGGTMQTLQLGVVNVTNRVSSPGFVQEHSTFDIGANTLTFTGNANTQTKIEARITGTGSVVINTAGIVNYYNPENTYTGSTTVQNGTLLIDTANNPWAPLDIPANGGTWNKFFGVTGALIIGDDNTANGLATVHLGDGTTQGSVSNGINVNSPVTIYRDGTFNVNGNSQTIGTLTMKGGTITTGVGTLFLDVANTTVSILDSDKPSVINGQLSLTHQLWAGHETVSDNRTFNVVYNSANDSVNNAGNVSVADLVINAQVQQGALTKTGNGTMLLTNSNIYGGATTINDGILRINNGTDINHYSSLGLGNSGNATIDTIVNSGGTLQIVGNITMLDEILTLRGTGYQNRGALENLQGNNTWGGGGATGQILLGADATIKSTSGTLTLASTTASTGGEFGLTVTGDGNTTITGAINTNVGNGTVASYVTKTGNGTLTLSGSSFYAGNTTISNGIVVITNSNALGATSAGTNVASGAELRLTNNISVGPEALALSGSGFGGTTGALNNSSGNNTFAGAITIGAPGTTIYSTTGTMTLSGSVSTAGNSFIIAGAGNTTMSGAVGGSGALTKNDGGTALLTNNVGVGAITMNAGNMTLSGASTTAAGTVTVNGGILSLNSASTTGGNVTVNTGTLNINNAGNATFGQVHLLGNATSVINVGGNSTVNTQEFNSSTLTTLNIAAGSTVISTYDAGNTLISGQITGSGTMKFLGNAQVTFDQTINSPNLTVYIGGTSIGTNAAPLTFSITDTAALTFKDIYITGDTILDFGNSSASFLSSTNLYITAGVKITVTNWISMNDAWYVTGNSPGFSGATLNQTGAVPENQITFTGFSNNNTAWISPAGYPQFRDHEIRPVPEPSTYGAIFAAGCVGLFGLRRYLRRRADAAAKVQ